MKKCKCASCSLARAVRDGKINKKELTDAFLLGYHYYGMWHTDEELDVAVDAIDVISLKYHKDTPSIFLIKYAQNAKDQITALEQKDE